VPRLPGSFSRLSILSYLHALSPHLQKVAEDSRAEADAAGGAQLLQPAMESVAITVNQAWLTLSILTVVCLIGAMIIFSTKAYAPREDGA